VIALGCIAPMLLIASTAGAPLRLLDSPLYLSGPSILAGALQRPSADLSVAPSGRSERLSAAADDRSGDDRDQPRGSAGADDKGETKRPDVKPKEPGSLDFDLLGAPPKSQQVDEHALRLRRTMLSWHQGVGLGMFALQLATTVVGQLNYNDKFGGDNTAKYVQPHAILAYSTLAAFVAAGTLALLAPAPLKKDEGFDRVKLHKVFMFTAAAGMAAQGVLGFWAQSREGYLNQQSIGTAHLIVGYVTLAAVAAGISALVF
jgi:hypothetical protein